MNLLSPLRRYPDRASPHATGPERVNWIASTPFLLMHLIPLGFLFSGPDLGHLWLGLSLYAVRMFFITAGYHRYFAHRGYKLGRGMQFVMAFGGASAVQKGPLWWAGNHRLHHRFSDTERDLHSPRHGFLWSHVGWILADRYSRTPLESIKDFAKYPELRWLDRYHLVPALLLATACTLLGGLNGLLTFFLSTVVLWHGTFTINSLAHVFGRRRYATEDTSKNSLLLALITLGEGWHNNHHHFPPTANQGFFWWEIDISYYVLLMLEKLGLARDLRRPPARVLERTKLPTETSAEPPESAPQAALVSIVPE